MSIFCRRQVLPSDWNLQRRQVETPDGASIIKIYNFIKLLPPFLIDMIVFFVILAVVYWVVMSLNEQLCGVQKQ